MSISFIKFSIVGLMCIIFLLVLYVFVLGSDSPDSDNVYPNNLESNILEKIGTVTAYDNGCYVDGVCSVEIDGKYSIPVNLGRRIESARPQLGKNDVTEKDIGSKVKFRAKVVDSVNDKYLSIDEKDTNEKFYLLKIVDHFACSDYCPGDEKRYMKTIYENITDKDECLKLNGEPYQYVGWGVRDICIVK